MKTRIVATLILILLLSGSAFAQGSTVYLPQVAGDDGEVTAAAVAEVPIILDGDHSIIVNCVGRRLAVSRFDDVSVQLTCRPYLATATPLPTATSTPASATATDTPIATSTQPAPTATNTPSSGGAVGIPGPPYAGAPACPDHDATSWHGLWDPARGCHYNHTHNADPTTINDIFGAPGALWGGQTISYPWETFNSSGHENHLKHEGYKYLVERDLPPDNLDLNWSFASDNNAIRAIRLQHHRLGGPLDLAVRLHSFYQEVEICKGARCGTMKFGGWTDYGILHSPYKGGRVLLPNQDGPYGPSRDLNLDPYRAAHPLEDVANYGTYPWTSCRTCGSQSEATPNDVVSLWTNGPPGVSLDGYNRLGGTFTIVFDDWQGIDRSNPGRLNLLCDPAINPCRFNSSEHSLFTAWAYVPLTLDSDGDGWVTFTGYTDRKGNVVSGCAAPGLDCVPLVIDDAPVGYAAWTVPANNGKWLDRWRDYDVSPAPEWWIEYPN